MRLTQLRYFAEICENEGNMTRAAGTLHVSQPALSKALHELEDELGVLLFRRVRQRLELTPEGEQNAQRVYERHRMLTDWLIRLGVSPEVAAADACRMEHDMSAETFACLKRHASQKDT